MIRRALVPFVLVPLVALGCSLGDTTDAVFGSDGKGSATGATGAGGGATTTSTTSGDGGGGTTTSSSSSTSTTTSSSSTSTTTTTTTGSCGGGDPSFACVPAPPAGAIAFLATRAPEQPATDCAGLAPGGTYGKDVVANDGGCACTCDTPQGGECNGGATLYQYGNCKGGNALLKSGCFDISSYGWVIGGVQTYATSIGKPGACAAGVTGAPAPAAFGTVVDRCDATPTQDGCDVGQVCVKKPAAPNLAACVEVAQGAACPAGFPEARTLYEGLEDGRACSANGCSCGGAQGQTCDVTVDLFENASCSGPPKASYPLDGSCNATGFAQNQVGSAQYDGQIVGGACPPKGAPSVSGQVVGKGAHTLCCAKP